MAAVCLISTPQRRGRAPLAGFRGQRILAGSCKNSVSKKIITNSRLCVMCVVMGSPVLSSLVLIRSIISLSREVYCDVSYGSVVWFPSFFFLLSPSLLRELNCGKKKIKKGRWATGIS